MSALRLFAATLAACCLAAVLATPSLAQYMYLDSNGNGVNDPGDVVNAIGVPTTVDLYIVTNRNRDGSDVVCHFNVPGGTPELLAYTVNLRATEGATVIYSNYINRQPSFGVRFNEFNPDGVRYQTGFATFGSRLPPGGPYLMATLTITAQTGSPGIEIVTQVQGALDATFLGLGCYSSNGDNVWLLGVDWFDVDGLGSGGNANNQPPALQQPADMTVEVGTFSRQDVTASDPDHQVLTLSLREAPAFAFLAPTSAEPGTAHGVVHLSPRTADAGNHRITLGVTDGALEAERTFNVTVVVGANHPPFLTPIPALSLVAGRMNREEVFAGDPDGGHLQLSMTSGPGYASFRLLRSTDGGAVGEIRLSPSLCEAGSATIVIAASDGAAQALMEIPVRVVAPQDPPPLLHLPFDAGGGRVPSDVALADLNRDGNLDAIVSFELSNEVSIHLGNGTGALTMLQKVSSGPGGWSMGTADFNSDGLPDVAVTNSSGASVSVLLGNGDGTLRTGVPFETGSVPHGIQVADLNSDGRTDLVVANASGGTISVLLGKGDGTFEDRMDTPVGSVPEDCVVADFNSDGRPDVAVTLVLSRTLTTLLGTGSGALRPAGVLSFVFSPWRLVAGDWDWNGAPDVAVFHGGGDGKFRTYRGNGEGEFEVWNDLGAYAFPAALDAADFDEDGETDIALVDGTALNLFRGLTGGGFGTPTSSLYGSGLLDFDVGDMNGDGLRDIVLTGLVVLNANTGGSGLQARGFLENENRTVPSSSSDSRVTLRLEPVNGSFAASDLDPATVRLSRADSDLPTEISPVLDKTIKIGDVDRNGVPEIPLSFARADWGSLFPDVRGRETVALDINATLLDGRKLCAKFDVSVVGTGGASPDQPAKVFSAAVAPNPLNPAGVIRFTTTRDGFARIGICDVRGRLVRSLLDARSIPAGDHETRFDGRSDNGESLASGVYFYHLETLEGVLRGRITILK
jgi:hypothetical protein